MDDIFKRLSKSSVKREDSRGHLEVLYENNTTILKRSFSKKGVFRGLHRQAEPFLQEKIIRVVSGSIVDFVVDVESESFSISSQKITPESDWVLIEGRYAHGFYALEDTVFEYICDGSYNEDAEESYSIAEYLSGLPFVDEVIMSEKDLAAKPITLDGKLD